jgi:hypothetical protein
MRYWKRVDSQGNTTTVESYSHDLDIKGAIEIGEAEFDACIASLPPVIPPEPPRDLAKEIDDLKARLGKLEKR